MTETDIAARLREKVGDQLRVVGHYDAESWNVEYMREDLQNAYETEELDAIADELVLDALDASHIQELFALGDLRGTMRLFDDGMVVIVPTSEQAGYLASMDDDASVKGRDVVAALQQLTA